jgi:hypothetical protein
MSRMADKMYKQQQKALILYNLEKEKAILAQKALIRKQYPIRFKTELSKIPSSVKDSFTWNVEVLDVDFVEVEDFDSRLLE